MAPFPWLPMMAMAIGLTSHSFCLTNLFPYAGYMVRHMGVTDDKDAAGYYAGYLASALMVGRFCCSYYWGRLSDRYGRLPVYRFSLWSMVFLQVAFGLSTNYLWALASRFFLGMLNGLIGTSKTMISEICGPEHEVVGMSFVTATWAIGYVIGPAAGGLLAEPAVHYPHLFSQTGLYGRFPYLLPNLVAAGLALVALPMSHLFLYETHPPCRARGDANDRIGFKPLSNSEPFAEDADSAERGGAKAVSLPLNKAGTATTCYGSSGEPLQNNVVRVGTNPGFDEAPAGNMANEQQQDGSEGTGMRHDAEHGGAGDEGPKEGTVPLRERDDEGSNPRTTEAHEKDAAPSFWGACSSLRLLSEKRAREVTLMYSVYSFVHIGFTEVYPLWAISTVANGGLDWTTQDIGEALSAAGMLMFIYQVGVYPLFINRVGMKTSHRWASVIAIPLYGCIPLLALLRGNETMLLLVTVLVISIINSCSCTVFVNIAVATNNAVDASKRGELNGLGMAINSMARALGPVVLSVIFAWSIDRPRPFPLGPHLAFLLLGLCMLLVAIIGWKVITGAGRT